MEYVAEELMEAARVIAVDPFAESPFMEHAIEEGLASGGGELNCIGLNDVVANWRQASWMISALWLRYAGVTGLDEGLEDVRWASGGRRRMVGW
jgi:hypothetical protein